MAEISGSGSDAPLAYIEELQKQNLHLETEWQMALDKIHAMEQEITLARLEGRAEAFALMWRSGTTDVKIDRSVLFGRGYDFFGLESLRQELVSDKFGYLIWPDNQKWSAYCDVDGGLMFDKFGSECEAKAWVSKDIIARSEMGGEVR